LGAQNVKVDISRICRVPEGFPAEKIEKSIKKLLVILDSYGVELGFELGEDDCAQSAKDLLSMTIRETERLRKVLQEAASKLGLEYPGDAPKELFSPDLPPEVAALPETQALACG
jgi:hypothetical protein